MQVRAPIDGTVQQLAVNTIGGVVTPAQALMLLVPNQLRLEVDARLDTKESVLNKSKVQHWRGLFTQTA